MIYEVFADCSLFPARTAHRHNALPELGANLLTPRMASSCQDNVFGPVVHGCRSDFDFTLLFEQSILAIGPTALLLLVAPSRIRMLLRSSKKTVPNQLGLIKSVCIEQKEGILANTY